MQAIARETRPSEKTELSLFEILPILLIAGCGFLVDVYDLVIFAVVRVSSLTSLGVGSAQLLSTGVFLLNMQMCGMMVGGVIWGIVGDKKGRKAALFGSILLYSLANLLNAFVTTVPCYAALRFIAGIGLAGEVGAAMTIAAEVTPAKYRGYGTAAVASLGMIGAIVGSSVADLMSWRIAYITCGVMGLCLLLARMRLKETPLFSKIQHDVHVVRGSLRQLFSDKKRIWKIARCVLAASPLWFVFGVLVSFAPEVCAGSNGKAAAISIAATALFYSLGETAGEIGSGITSQLLHSRKKTMLIFILGSFLLTFAVLRVPVGMYVYFCAPLGFFVGVWSVVITSAAEQFGTNLRSTATTLVPNMVRASAIPITLLFSWLCSIVGPSNGAMITGMISLGLAAVSVLFMEETFGKDLDFLES